MSGRVRTHLRHNLVGYLALFVSLSTGTAWAVEATITSADIVDNEIRSADIRNGTVTKFALLGNILSMQNVAALVSDGPKLGVRARAELAVPGSRAFCRGSMPGYDLPSTKAGTCTCTSIFRKSSEFTPN